MKQIMGGFEAGQQMPRVSKAQGCCFIDPDRQVSMSYCNLLNPLLIHIKLAPDLLLLLYLFLPCLPFQVVAVKPLVLPWEEESLPRQGRTGQWRRQRAAISPHDAPAASGWWQRAALLCQGPGLAWAQALFLLVSMGRCIHLPGFL